jgi:hypothetical protein
VISNGFAKLSFFSNPLFLICLLFLELAALFTCLQIQNKPVIKGILVMSCLISWGVMIQWNASSQTHFELPSYINRYIIYCRNGLIDKINKTILPKEANGFALALLIGVKMDMNKALVNAYTQLGIIHIIAISGMHLDILFKSLKRLTSYFPKNRNSHLTDYSMDLYPHGIRESLHCSCFSIFFNLFNRKFLYITQFCIKYNCRWYTVSNINECAGSRTYWFAIILRRSHWHTSVL